MVGQAQKEALAEPQYPAPGSSSQRLLQMLLASLPTVIGSRLATSTMEPRSKWHIPTPPHLQLYDVKTLAQYLESFSLHLSLLILPSICLTLHSPAVETITSLILPSQPC